MILTEDLELHIIEIPKIYRTEGKEEELTKWIYFIENPESEKVGEYMKENKEMKEAKEKLEVMSEDERMQILAELKEKAIRDEKATERYGMKVGMERGLKRGRREKEKEIAKRMKEKGFDIKDIQELTKLTQKEIEAL